MVAIGQVDGDNRLTNSAGVQMHNRNNNNTNNNGDGYNNTSLLLKYGHNGRMISPDFYVRPNGILNNSKSSLLDHFLDCHYFVQHR